MVSVREGALLALYSVVANARGGWRQMWADDDAGLMWGDEADSQWNRSATRAERNLAEISDVGPNGLMVLRDGEPGEPDMTFSPLLYHYEHVVDLEVYVQDEDDALRSSILDAILGEIGRALRAGPDLSGAVEACWPEAPQLTDHPFDTAQPLKAALVPIVLAYATPDPLG